MKELQEEFDWEMEGITHERGREFLQEAGVMLLPKWDISSTIIFDSFMSENKTLQLTNEASDKIYVGSGYNPNNATLQI